MKIKNPVFIKSAAAKDGFYITPKPLVAVAGKSNVGKSSLINMLANNRKLARTSVTPGRTRLVNYFDFGDFVLADLPGYGFARVSKDEKLAWARLTDSFFAEHKITLLLSLIDIRHPPTEDDKTLVNYLYQISPLLLPRLIEPHIQLLLLNLQLKLFYNLYTISSFVLC